MLLSLDLQSGQKTLYFLNPSNRRMSGYILREPNLAVAHSDTTHLVSTICVPLHCFDYNSCRHNIYPIEHTKHLSSQAQARDMPFHIPYKVVALVLVSFSFKSLTDYYYNYERATQ